MVSGGQYAWTKLHEPLAREFKPEYLYNPFEQGGIIFCQHYPARQGTAQFESVHLIPQGWETAISPAYQTFKQSSELFTTPSSSSHYAELSGLLHRDNSVVAVMAFRTLAENRRIGIPLLKEALDRSQGYRQAAFVYLMLMQPGQINDKALISELTNVIRATNAPERHRPIAIAIAAVRLLNPDLRMPQSLGPKVITTLQSRSTRRGAEMIDPYLRTIFEIMGAPAN
jgi:hypothetical protein